MRRTRTPRSKYNYNKSVSLFPQQDQLQCQLFNSVNVAIDSFSINMRISSSLSPWFLRLYSQCLATGHLPVMVMVSYSLEIVHIVKKMKRLINSHLVVRAPCPMLNTLANHGYLPRNGKNINKAMAADVLSSVLNWDVSVVNDLSDFAQPTTTDPNATTIDLNHLATHNIFEHDGSLRSVYILPCSLLNF